MLLDILAHLVALDIGWFINFVIGNSFWVMIFAAAAYFMSNRRALFAGTLLALYLHSTVDAAAIVGWTFQKGFFFIPIVVFFGQLLFDTFLGNTKFAPKRAIFTTMVLFYAAMVVLNVFVK